VTSLPAVPSQPAELALVHLLEEDRERVLDYVAPDLAESSQRAYRSHLSEFAAWCAGRGYSPLPASEATVIAYLTWAVQQGKLRPSSARAVKSAISVMHDAAGHPNPTRGPALKNALARLDREFQGGRRKQARAALADDIRAMVAAMGTDLKLIDLRDVALLWTGFGGAMRREEAVALDVDDLERMPGGRTRAHIRSSKTDQTAVGKAVTLPRDAVDAVHVWLAAARIDRGPIFRRMIHRTVSPHRLSDQSVRLIVQARAEAAGLGPGWSGHSLRRGAATEAVANGASVLQLKRLGRWKSTGAAELYVDDSAWADDPERLLGLARDDVPEG
jgi:site-specific recombinase XerD